MDKEKLDEIIVNASKKVDTNKISLTFNDNDGNPKSTVCSRQFVLALLEEME